MIRFFPRRERLNYRRKFFLATAFLFFIATVGNFADANSPASIVKTGNAVKNCQAKGIALHGKVKVVSAFADFKVQVVDAFPDLKVRKVDAFPNRCGEWQFVENFPDFTIEYVTAFPDLKIQFVNAFPGE